MDIKEMNTELHQYTETKKKELKSLAKTWDDLCAEVPQKFMQLVKSGMKPKIERGNTGNSRQLSVSMSFEMNTDAAKAYLEEVRVQIQDVMEGFKNNMTDINDKLKYYYEAKADEKEISNLIKVFVNYYDYVSEAKMQISKQTICFDISEETTETCNKWKQIDRELSRVAEAKRLGVDISVLDTHKIYLDAKRKQANAKTSAAKRQAAKMFSDIKTYLDAEALSQACLKEAEVLKAKEDEEERLRREEEERKRKEEEARRLEEERQRKEAEYTKCLEVMANASTSEDYQRLIKQWKKIDDYKDVKEKINECTKQMQIAKEKEEEAERLRLEEEKRQHLQSLYDEAVYAMEQNTISSYQDAMVLLKEVGNFKDADSLTQQCKEKIEELKQREAEAKAKAEQEEKERQEKEEAERKAKEAKKKKYMRLISLVSAIIIVISIAVPYYKNTIVPNSKYNKAMDLLESQKFDEAEAIFTELGSYEDSQDMITETRYQKAIYLYENKDYEEAVTLFGELGYYESSSSYKTKAIIEWGQSYFDEEKYQEAVDVLESIKYNDDAEVLYFEAMYQLGLQQFKNGQYDEGYATLYTIRNYNDALEVAQELYYEQGLVFYDALDFEKSNAIFTKLGSYKDSKSLIHEHNFTQEVISELTCEQDGEIVYTCDCGTVNTEVTKATGHQYTEVSCTEASKCTNCGLIQQEALGHTVENNVCTTCGDIVMDPIVIKGSNTSNTEENKHTITVPKGNYLIAISAKINVRNQRWSMKVDGSEIYFGAGASLKSGDFTAEQQITKNNTETTITVKMNGSYTITITPIND